MHECTSLGRGPHLCVMHSTDGSGAVFALMQLCGPNNSAGAFARLIQPTSLSFELVCVEVDRLAPLNKALLAPDYTLNEAWQLGNRCPKKISTGLSSVRRGVFGVQN